MNKNQKLILEWLRVYMEEESTGTFSALAVFMYSFALKKLPEELYHARAQLTPSEEREILAELAKE